MGQSPTTLVVEHHRDCREVLVLALELSGFRVLAARTGGEALACLHDHTPQSIVIDTALPDRDAIDVVRVLRANQRFDHTTVVLAGTWIPEPDRSAAVAAGVDAVLIKPFAVEDLLDRVSLARRRAPHGHS
ncbi:MULTISPECIES: response regulator transcription factor [Ramlibacter]|uniref:Response regulator n=1 Tax=Ramlibacter pinisoli TaxID=2682844 RepID=A0A6N8IYF3_9BURK|nr:MULTISPECIES: response regulator [Ramlibacter]MBA2962098.1 response regulator [Ramlibacter sp. CGMCC 1.13660]MVQ32041.1 response regulator [Ramlibacter pinisoli]